jgi:hypothetical protein
MILSEIVDLFKRRYSLECLKRRVTEIVLGERDVVTMLSETCGDIQKAFGVIETSLSIPIIAGTDKYDLNASIMTVKDVMIGCEKLTEKSTAWMQSRVALNCSPGHYTILYSSAIPKIWIYGNPIIASTMVVSFQSNFNFYSPSQVTAGDFGSFLNSAYTGNTCFPTQYDKLILLGMLKQMFPEIAVEYSKEELLLMSKQFNGESFTKYSMDGVINKGRSFKIRDL